MNNTELWQRAFKTNPDAVKPITGKDYGGNSPKPYYIVQRLTEEFGPCGIGWGFSVVHERFERFSDTETLHVALIDFWYELEGKRGGFQQMGQTRASYVTSSQKFKVDEDAPKKSVTDALVKCASYLGFAGDIFSGRWDDSKYVAELKREFNQERANWLADWLAAIDAAATVGELKEVMTKCIAEAKHEKDADAEGQFLAAQATKIAKAKKEKA